MPRRSAPFWSLVDQRGPDECWLWTGRTVGKGYGGYGRTTAHRHAYVLTYGPLPPGAVVRHTCDNPPCCNPAHLRSGTYQDNTDDMMTKGRWHQGATPKGATHHFAKLTDEQVAEIRRLYAAGGISQRELGERFGVKQSQVGRIVRGSSRRVLDSTE